MLRKRGSTIRRKSSASGPVSKKAKIIAVIEPNYDSGTDPCLSDAETLPGDACRELGIPVITVDDSDSSSSSEPEVCFSEHEKKSYGKSTAPSMHNCSAGCSVCSPAGNSRGNRKSSTESEVNGCFEMLFSEESIKKEPPDNACSSENMSAVCEYPFNQITCTPTESSGEVETSRTNKMRTDYNDKCYISMLHASNLSRKNSAAVPRCLPATSGKSKMSSSEFPNTSTPIMSITPHIKVEREEIESPDNVKCSETLAKPVADGSGCSVTILKPCEVGENPGNTTALSFKNKDHTCRLSAEQGRNSDEPRLLLDQVAQVKSELSGNQENGVTHINMASDCKRVKDENVIQYEHLCNITCELKNIPEALLHSISDSQNMSRMENASLETGCDTSPNSALKNYKSPVSTGDICSEDSSSSRYSPFDLSTLSLNPTEQKAAEVVGSLPLEKLRVVIREYVERRCLDLEPILQETSKEPSKSCNQTDSTTYVSERKHTESILPHMKVGVRNNFCQNQKRDYGDVEILHDSWQQESKDFINIRLIKTENNETLPGATRKFDSTKARVLEQNSNVHSPCSFKCDEVENNFIPSVGTKCVPCASTEDNSRSLHSSVDRTGPNFASNESGCAGKISLTQSAKDSSVEFVSKNQNLAMKNVSPVVEAYTDKHYSSGNEMGGNALYGRNPVIKADLLDTAIRSSVQLMSESQQNLLINHISREKCQSTYNKMGRTVETTLSCSSNSVNLVPQSQQILLHKDISNVENSKDKQQSPDKHGQSSEAAKISNEKNCALNDELVVNQLLDFHYSVAESHGSGFQVKKELEDSSLLNNIKSIFRSEGGAGFIDINKLLSLETLRAIVDAVSGSSGKSFVSSNDVTEAICSTQNPFSSTKLNDTAFTNSLKKENGYNDNLQTPDILPALVQTCETSVVTSPQASSLGTEHYHRDLPNFEKQELKPVESCKKGQEIIEFMLPTLGSKLSSKCDEMCGKQLPCGTSLSESKKQNQSSGKPTVEVTHNVQSTSESGSNVRPVEGNQPTCGIQNTNLYKNSAFGSDVNSNSVSGKENLDSREIPFNACRKGNSDSRQNANSELGSLCGEKDFSCRSVGDDDTKIKKRGKYFSSEVSKMCKLAINDDTPQSVQEKNSLYVNSSDEKCKNLIAEGLSTPSSMVKENDDLVVSKKYVNENMKSKQEKSLDKTSDVPIKENATNFHDEEICAPSKQGQVEAIEKASLHSETPEPGMEIPQLKPQQESSTCVTNSGVSGKSLCTKGSNKVQRFASRASFLTKEMLDVESKIIQRQQKVLKGKKIEQTVNFNSDEGHLLVKTPELNINTCDKNFSVSEEHSRSSAFDIDPRTETVINDVTMPSASNIEDPKQIDTTVYGDQCKPSVYGRDPRRKNEVWVNREYGNGGNSGSLNNTARINSNTGAKLNEEYKKIPGFAESQTCTQFPPVAKNHNQYYQNMYDANNSFWNNSNSVHRNQYSGIEYPRSQRYLRFPPYNGSASPWFSGYSNNSLPGQPTPQSLPPHSQFGFPPQSYQGVPSRPVFSTAVCTDPLRTGFPPWNSFSNNSSLDLHRYYSSEAYLSFGQPSSVPTKSTESPVFHPAVSTGNSLPSITTPSKASAAVTRASVLIHTGKTFTTRTEPVQSEYISSTKSKNSCGASHCKAAKVAHRVHSSELALPSPPSPSELGVFVSDSVSSPKAVTVDLKSCKKNLSSVSHSRAPKNMKSLVLTYDDNKNKLPSRDFFNNVLIWSVNWLQQQLEMSDPPPITDKTKKAESVYKCYNDYYNTYFPFLLLETWEIIFQSWKRHRYLHDCCCLLKQYAHDKKMYELHFETIVSCSNFSNGKYPAEGHLVVIKFGLKESGSTKIYGYVSSHSFRPFSVLVDSSHPCCKAASCKPAEGDLILSLVVKTSWKSDNINSRMLVQVQTLYFLKPIVKQFNALVKVQHSPLCKALLTPKEENCKLISLPKGQSVKTNKDPLTELGFAILQPNPQIVVVEAGPGTNKLNTFVQVFRIIKSFEASVGKVKLLFCSQSSEMLDSVSCSLVYSQSGLEEKNKLHCVRMGKLSDIHPDMRNLSLHSLVKNYIETLREHELEECEKEITELINKMTDTHGQIALLKKVSATFASMLEETIPELQKQLKEKLKKKEIVKIKHESLREQHEKEAQWSILMSSDITFTTLNDYHQLEVSDSSGRKTFIPFNCCIIDGADLCSELETLPPLLSGIEKLVVCGDPDVAPVVLSKIIEKHDPYLSCFRRVRNQIYSSDKRKG